MGFTEVLTIIFIVLKLLGKIDWSWFLVLLPEIIAVAIYIILCIAVVVQNYRINKSINRILKDTFKDMWGQWNNECCVADCLKHIETATLGAWISWPSFMVGLLPYRQKAKAQDFDSCIGGSNPSGAVGISQWCYHIFISSFFPAWCVPQTHRSSIGYVKTSDSDFFCD